MDIKQRLQYIEAKEALLQFAQLGTTLLSREMIVSNIEVSALVEKSITNIYSAIEKVSSVEEEFLLNADKEIKNQIEQIKFDDESESN